MDSCLVIPLAGYGKKFVRVGYKTLKPFLKIDQNNNMLDLIIRNFPKNIKKIFIVRRNIQPKYLKILKKYKNSEILFIKSHNLGSLYSLYLVKKELSKLKNIFLSYCDIHWSRKNTEIKKLENNFVYCFKNWHPFTVDNNNYAFCKSINKKIIAIREKNSFTKKWQEEPLSIGLFFFKLGAEMVNSFEKIIEKKIKINNEYYPSLAFNFIKNKKVKYVNYFCHIGKPDYFEIFKKWYKFYTNKESFKNKIKKVNLADKIIIPAAGRGQRFLNENIKTPKFLCKVGINKKKMISLIKDYLPNNKKIQLITLRRNTNFLRKNFEIHSLNKITKGQADTVMHVLDKTLQNKSIFINSCDAFSLFNINLYRALKNKSDILIFVSQNIETDSATNEGTWIKSKNNKVQRVYVKTPKIKNSLRLTGNFYFKNKNIFIQCFKKVIKNRTKKEILIDNLVEEGVKMNLKVYCISDDIYLNMGTPKLLKEFNFWENYFNVY